MIDMLAAKKYLFFEKCEYLGMTKTTSREAIL